MSFEKEESGDPTHRATTATLDMTLDRRKGSLLGEHALPALTYLVHTPPLGTHALVFLPDS